MSEPTSSEPTETALRGAIDDAVAENPTRALRVIVDALGFRGVRCLLVAVGAGSAPQVRATLTANDVTSESVKLATAGLLRCAELPDDMVQMFAAAAGGYATRWLDQQRAKAAARGAAGQPASSPGPARWQPRGPGFGRQGG